MIFEKRNVPGAMVNGVIFFPHGHTETLPNTRRAHTYPVAVCVSIPLLLTRLP